METLKIIEQLQERIAEHETDIKFYQGMVEAKKQEELALREKVEQLNQSIEKEYGEA